MPAKVAKTMREMGILVFKDKCQFSALRSAPFGNDKSPCHT